ncbi:MAG: serpin family protein [Planctomycetota bacterium]|nr:MAG: serpin family protein [Planctomycetota bacterium]
MHDPRLLSLALGFVACSFLALLLPSSPLSAQSKDQSQDRAAVCARASNEFGFRLFQQIREAKGNLFYSPYSVAVGLAMTRAGADGETAKQMDAVLAAKGLQLPALHAALAKALEPGKLTEGWRKKRKQVPVFTLDVANRIWLQQGLQIGDDFALAQKESYHAPIGRSDFQKTEAARKLINDWVAERTRNKIQDIMPAGLPTPDTLIALGNAIYFKAAWAKEFEGEATKEQAFHRQDGSTIDVPMMNSTKTYAYGESKSAQLLAIPYKGNECEMLLLLPKKGTPLDTLEKQLDAQTAKEWIAQMKPCGVKLTLPKFEMTSSFEISRALQKMGMVDAFDVSKAEFSKISRKEPIVIGPVLHKAFISIDEKGSEAAAATAVMLKLGFERRPENPLHFVADRPFVFAIRHRQTGALLFVGRVADPSKS